MIFSEENTSFEKIQIFQNIFQIIKLIIRQGWSGLSEPFHFRTAGSPIILDITQLICNSHVSTDKYKRRSRSS